MTPSETPAGPPATIGPGVSPLLWPAIDPVVLAEAWRQIAATTRAVLRAAPPLGRVLTQHLEQGRRRSERLARHLTQLLDMLAAARVTPTVLKGSDTAHRYFPEPGTRPRSDIDLLIRPDQRAVAGGDPERGRLRRIPAHALRRSIGVATRRRARHSSNNGD